MKQQSVAAIFPEEAQQWKALYEAGMTIEELALETGYHINTISRALHETGTQMRKPGQRPGTVRNEPTRGRR